MRTAVSICVTVCVLCGCAPSNEEKPPTAKKRQKPSTVSLVVDGVTGRAAVRAGKKARKTVEDVSAAHQSDLDEIMGDE